MAEEKQKMKQREEALLQTPPKALTFDVFGTVVDWRSTVTTALIERANEKKTASETLPPTVHKRLSEISEEDWGRFAQEWRNSYKKFTKGYKPDEDEWRDIDTHHHLSLIELLEKWDLTGLYTDVEVKTLSEIWHFLTPWPDSAAGIKKLNTKFTTSTLSNGNQSLLRDLNRTGELGFMKLQSSEDFKAYKPHPRTYQGAARVMGLQTNEVVMVAAHLNDLEKARENGMRTVYVERKGEEDWAVDGEDWKAARGWVDLWVSVGEGEGGLLEVAKRLGC